MVEVRFEPDTWEGLFANVTEHQKRLIRKAVKADLNDYQEANDGGLPLMGRQRFCAKGCSFPNGMLWVVYIPLRLSAASAGKVICRLDILVDHPPSVGWESSTGLCRVGQLSRQWSDGRAFPPAAV